MLRAAPAIDTSDRPFGLPPDIVIDLPVPPSVNRVRRIDWSSSKLLACWKKHADDLVLWAKCRPNNPLKMRTISRFELLIVLSESHTRIDLDNAVKLAIDYLRRIELIEDDGPKHMRKLTVVWGPAPEGARITVREIA